MAGLAKASNSDGVVDDRGPVVQGIDRGGWLACPAVHRFSLKTLLDKPAVAPLFTKCGFFNRLLDAERQNE